MVKDENADPALCNLVLVFSSTEILSDASIYTSLKNEYPRAQIILNSTAGEIAGTEVSDDSISLTAIWFEKIKIKTAAIQIEKMKNSFEAGRYLASELDPVDLK